VNLSKPDKSITSGESNTPAIGYVLILPNNRGRPGKTGLLYAMLI
jgi:hypothetical protein